MNGFLGLAEIGWRRSQEQPELRRNFASILDSGKFLLTVVNDILDFSKIAAGKLEVEQFDLNPGRVLRQVVEHLRDRATERGIALELDLGPGCRGDPVRLAQVFFNLVSNAVKFAPQGRGSVAADGDQLVVRIADTGIGMDLTQVQRLLVPFAQGDAGTTRRFGGTGLGLAITRRLVDLMGGEVRVESTPRKGSEFAVHLPYGAATGVVLDPDWTPPPAACGPRLGGCACSQPRNTPSTAWC